MTTGRLKAGQYGSVTPRRRNAKWRMAALAALLLALLAVAAFAWRLAAKSELTAAGAPAEVLFFKGCREACGLWATEGTAESTRLLMKARRGVHDLTVAGSLVYFGLLDELWRSDGTPQGTVRVFDFAPGFSPDPALGIDRYGLRKPVAVGDSLFFFVGDGSQRALWFSDGTATGTRRVTWDAGLPAAGELSPIGELSGALILSSELHYSRRQLWSLDPGELELRPVDGSVEVYPGASARLGRKLFFIGRDWYDGRPGEGVVALGERGAELLVGNHFASWRPSLAAAGPALFFTADDGVHGAELWTSRGTADTTRLVADLRPGTGHPPPRFLAPAGESLFFVTDEATTPRSPAQSRRLWVTDGSARGTRPLGLLQVETGYQAVALGGRIFFWVLHGEQAELWTSDGSAAGTRRVPKVPTAGGSTGRTLHRLGRRVLADTGAGVYATDGSADGTERLGFIPRLDLAAVAAPPAPSRRSAVRPAAPTTASRDERTGENVVSVAQVSGLGDLMAVAPSPDLGGFVALAREPPALHVIQAHGVTQTLPLAAEPRWLALSPAGRRAVVLQQGHQVTVVDVRSASATFSAPVRQDPYGYSLLADAAVTDDGPIALLGERLWLSHDSDGPFEDAGRLDMSLRNGGAVHPSGDWFLALGQGRLHAVPFAARRAAEPARGGFSGSPSPEDPGVCEPIKFIGETALLDACGNVFEVTNEPALALWRRGQVPRPAPEAPSAVTRIVESTRSRIVNVATAPGRGELLAVATQLRIEYPAADDAAKALSAARLDGAAPNQLLIIDRDTLAMRHVVSRFAYRRDGVLRHARPVAATPLAGRQVLVLLEEVQARRPRGCWAGRSCREVVWTVGVLTLPDEPQ